MPDITKNMLDQTIQDRCSNGTPHDTRSLSLFSCISQIDFYKYDDGFCWKSGGDGDNGEYLMYILDDMFELFDKRLIELPNFIRNRTPVVKKTTCSKCGITYVCAEYDDPCPKCFPEKR